MKVVIVKFKDTCDDCGEAIRAGAFAQYETTNGHIYCLVCRPVDG